jgi:hypothetical protein
MTAMGNNQRASNARALVIWCCVFAAVMSVAGFAALIMLWCGAGVWSLGFYALAGVMAHDLARCAAWPRG